MPQTKDITRLLHEGNSQALEELFPMVCGELHNTPIRFFAERVQSQSHIAADGEIYTDTARILTANQVVSRSSNMKPLQ